MSITIKKATLDDSAFLAQMILQSSRAGKKDGLFDLLFKTNDNAVILDKLEALIKAQAKSHCHFSNFLIAQVNNENVGSLCSFEPRIATKEVFLEALSEIDCVGAKESLEIMYCCDFNLNIRTLMFDFMEEVEGFMDVEILKALMQKSLLNARLKGYRIGQTIIEIGSLEAKLFYTKLGFKEVKQIECDLYKERFGRPGLMLLEIEF